MTHLARHLAVAGSVSIEFLKMVLAFKDIKIKIRYRRPKKIKLSKDQIHGLS